MAGTYNPNDFIGAGLVDLDLSYVVMLVMFLALFFLINRSFLQPLLEMFDKRHALTVGAREAAADAVEQAEQRITEYEERVGNARRKAVSLSKELRAEGQRSERTLIEQAQRESNAEVEAGLSDLASVQAKAEQELEATAAGLGGQMADRILGGA